MPEDKACFVFNNSCDRTSRPPQQYKHLAQALMSSNSESKAGFDSMAMPSPRSSWSVPTLSCSLNSYQVPEAYLLKAIPCFTELHLIR
jgi:hypothetical protein